MREVILNGIADSFLEGLQALDCFVCHHAQPRRKLGVLSAALLLSSTSAAPWPTKEWKASTPEAQGLDAGVLRTLDQEFATGRHGYIDGLLVIRNGMVVYWPKGV